MKNKKKTPSAFKYLILIVLFFVVVVGAYMIFYGETHSVQETPPGQLSDAVVEMYSRASCPYCQKAKMLLDEKGIAYIVYDVAENPGQLVAMRVRTKGAKTVPQIFINGRLIGGYAELRKLADSGKLNKILGYEPIDNSLE
jgi:GrxC family glutaredoxin